MSPQPERMMTIPKPYMCDFCAKHTKKLVMFPAADFTRRAYGRGDTLLIQTCLCHTPIELEPGDVLVWEQNSYGAWAACTDCERAIRANDDLALATIAFKRGKSGLPLDFYLGNHTGFWAHREGSN